MDDAGYLRSEYKKYGVVLRDLTTGNMHGPLVMVLSDFPTTTREVWVLHLDGPNGGTVQRHSTSAWEVVDD